jgi:hypothetical protein
MKTAMILFAVTVLGVAASGCGCRSQAVSKEPNEIDQVIDEAIVRGADIPPAKRGLIVRMLRLNEKDLLLGLRTYADLSGGRYPASLETETTLKEIETNRLGSNLTDTPTSKKDQMLLDIWFATAFYDKLRREKRAEQYHGDTVSWQDASRVLMSWTESKERYRVVFGDLTAKTLSAEQFTKLAQSP